MAIFISVPSQTQGSITETLLTDANNATVTGFYKTEEGATNVPNDAVPWGIIHMELSSDGSVAQQLAMSGSSFFKRSKSTTWSAWSPVDTT